MNTGYIHSYESMGLVDGPGIRFVVFLQGCPLRCAFCHNPDTWQTKGGKAVTSDELVNKILRYKPYFSRSHGGVTFSGGEPLLQYDFLLETVKKCKENGIHTAIDTSGVGHSDCRELLQACDLVMLDIKHTTDIGYERVTGIKKSAFDGFLEQVKEIKPKVWLRAVITPGINDSFEYIQNLWDLAKKIPRVKKIELLPYHTLGVNKYDILGIDYPLKDVPPMNKELVKEWQAKLDAILISDN